MKIVNNLTQPITYFLFPGDSHSGNLIASGKLNPGDVAQYNFDYKIGADRLVPNYFLKFYSGRLTGPPPPDNYFFASVPLNATFEVASKLTTPMFGPYGDQK